MKLKKFSNYLTICLVAVFLFFGFAGAAYADVSQYFPDEVDDLHVGDASPERIVVDIINWGLGVLALVAVVMILIGGFQWMTAGGNEERIEKAKKLLIAAVIGLLIILAAWGISSYAVNVLGNVTGA
ncbi:MAG: pilin [Patescibacteria group bacterium]